MFEEDFIQLLCKAIHIHEMLHFKSFHVCDNRGEEVVTSAEMPLVKEVTTTLREWGSIWKQLFVVISQEKSLSALYVQYMQVSVTATVSPSRPINGRELSRSRG